MSHLLDVLSSPASWPIGGPWAYLMLFLAATAESAAFIGLVVPGETVLVLAGVLVASGRLTIVPVLAAAGVGAVVGDQIGYLLGRALGPGMRRSGLGRRVGAARWERAEALVDRHGGVAVLLGRWIGVLRAIVPAVAGATGMRRTTFTAWNAVGGLAWASAVVAVGALAGASWSGVLHWLGAGSAIVAAVLVAAGVVLWRHRRTDSGSVHHGLIGHDPASPASDPIEPSGGHPRCDAESPSRPPLRRSC